MLKRRLKLEIKNLIGQIEINTKPLITPPVISSYKTAFKGLGLEFDSFRKYVQGDDAAFIDWKASIKSNTLLIKQFIEERNLNVFFLLDVSSSMLFGSIEKLKNQYAAEIVASLSLTVMRSDDKIGFAMFNKDIIKPLLPKSGEKQYYNILYNLVNLNLYGGSYNLENALKFINSFLPPKSLLFIVSDFIGLSGNWEKHLKITCSKFDVITLMIRDPRDRELPQGIEDIVVASPYKNKKVIIKPELIKEEYEAYVKQQELQIKNIFTEAGSDFLILTTDKPYIKPLMLLFKRRALKFR